jgi:hypothetical protein
MVEEPQVMETHATVFLDCLIALLLGYQVRQNHILKNRVESMSHKLSAVIQKIGGIYE